MNLMFAPPKSISKQELFRQSVQKGPVPEIISTKIITSPVMISSNSDNISYYEQIKTFYEY